MIRKNRNGESRMRTEKKALNWRRIGLLLALAAALVLITVWAQGYYSKKVFHMEGLKYAKYADLGSGSIEYRASFGRGEPIYVHTYEEEKRVEIAGEIYEIREYGKESGYSASYEVLYPGEKAYRAKPFGDRSFLSYDEKGEMMVPGIMFSDGTGQVHRSDPEEPRYFPSELVKASDVRYHDPNGSVGFFILALVMLIYAWCGFRYEAFQRFLFHISPSNWMVENPEPSDFYFFMCKVGGIFGIGFSLWIFFTQAL
ncbi:hypothetical protein [Paenibacillus lautus]|uniref:hypothetical protein n=1 Tax=Paenibacillus lautus TaxID=1401 RepID=UPI001FD05B0C|nr:hypothetical protein [Paenibacillus lautus]